MRNAYQDCLIALFCGLGSRLCQAACALGWWSLGGVKILAPDQRGRALHPANRRFVVYLCSLSIPPPPVNFHPTRQQAARRTQRRSPFAKTIFAKDASCPPAASPTCIAGPLVSNGELGTQTDRPHRALPHPATLATRPSLETKVFARGTNQLSADLDIPPLRLRGKLPGHRAPLRTRPLAHCIEAAANTDDMASPEQMGIDSTRRNRIPRSLTDDERARLDEFIDSIHYSTRWAPRA